MLLVADGITGCGEFESNCCCDITGVYLVQLLTLVSVHLKETSYTLLLILGSVQYIGTGINGTRVCTEVSKLTYKGVSHNLECECCERLFVGRVSLNLVAVQVNTLDSRDVKRRRHILYDCIQKLLNALISVCSTTTYGYSCTLAGSFTESCFQLLLTGLLTFQIHHGQVIVQLTNLFNHISTVFFRLILHISKVVGNGDIIALLIIVDISFHLKQVNDALELIFLADRQLDYNGILAQSGLNLLYSSIEVCTKNVHLVDECHTRYIVSVSLTPYVLRLRLNATLCAENADSAIQYTKGTLNFYGEVYVSGGINDVDTML